MGNKRQRRQGSFSSFVFLLSSLSPFVSLRLSLSLLVRQRYDWLRMEGHDKAEAAI